MANIIERIRTRHQAASDAVRGAYLYDKLSEDRRIRHAELSKELDNIWEKRDEARKNLDIEALTELRERERVVLDELVTLMLEEKKGA